MTTWRVFEYVCAHFRGAMGNGPTDRGAGAGGVRELLRSTGKEEAMRMVKWNAFLSGLCASALVLGVVAGGAHADVTIEKGASILIFPKVRVKIGRAHV